VSRGGSVAYGVKDRSSAHDKNKGVSAYVVLFRQRPNPLHLPWFVLASLSAANDEGYIHELQEILVVLAVLLHFFEKSRIRIDEIRIGNYKDAITLLP
jgi:hypothetical protein